MTRSDSPGAARWTGALSLAAAAVVVVMTMATASACLPGCAPRDTGKTVNGSSAASPSKSPGSKSNLRSRSNIPEAAGSPTGSPTAAMSATDPCATRLHELCGPLLHYYALNRHLPEQLDELTALAGPGDAALSFECPVSGRPYVYVPGGFPWGDKPGFVVLHDAEPSHSGFRWAVVVEEPKGAQPLITRVVAVPEPLFLSPGRTGDADAGEQ